MKGSPSSAPRTTLSTGSPFLLTVEMYPLTLQKFDAPSRLLNVPEIFCWTFTILISRSARLLVNGTQKSVMNRSKFRRD